MQDERWAVIYGLAGMVQKRTPAQTNQDWCFFKEPEGLSFSLYPFADLILTVLCITFVVCFILYVLSQAIHVSACMSR